MPVRQATMAEKIIELSLSEIGGLFYAKRLSERHRELFRKLMHQYGKPQKSVKETRKAWKDKGKNFSGELLKMREE